MRHTFGFVDAYSKVTYGMRDTLQDDDDALFRTAVAGAGAGKVVLSMYVKSMQEYCRE